MNGAPGWQSAPAQDGNVLDLALGAAWADGFRECVELGPGSALRRALRWLGLGEIRVAVFPHEAPHGHPREDAGC